jgi:hypothetical protein
MPGSASVFKPSLIAVDASDYDGVFAPSLTLIAARHTAQTPAIFSTQSYVWRADGEVARLILTVGRNRPDRHDRIWKPKVGSSILSIGTNKIKDPTKRPVIR